MPRFYFHVRAGKMIYEDHEGAELPDVRAAVFHAAEDAREIMRDDPDRLAVDRWIEVVDEIGNTVRTVPFVTITLRPASVVPNVTKN